MHTASAAAVIVLPDTVHTRYSYNTQFFCFMPLMSFYTTWVIRNKVFFFHSLCDFLLLNFCIVEGNNLPNVL